MPYFSLASEPILIYFIVNGISDLLVRWHRTPDFDIIWFYDEDLYREYS